MSNTPEVNIVVTTYNRIDYNKISIPNIKETASNTIPFMLTVVDNGSTDGTVELLKEQYEKGIIDNLILLKENLGVAKGQNLGWKLFENIADYYGKVDNDCLFKKKNWLNPIIFTLRKIPQIGALGYNCEPTSYPLVGNTVVKIRVKQGNIGGACFFIPKHIKEKVGYWCEEYGQYGEEDADMGMRISCSGFLNAYLPDEKMIDHLPEHCPDYRKFKDNEREDNLQKGKGPFWKNVNLYRNRQKLKFESNILNEVNYEIYSRYEKI